MSSEQIKIDVIVPVYNSCHYIDKCMNVLLKQSSINIVLVDDGSNDGSEKIVNKYANNYSNVNVIHKPNGGLSSARNAGLEYVKSDYFAFVDPDDWVSNAYFDLAVKELKKNPVDVLMTPYIRKYKDTESRNFVFGDKKVKFDKNETRLVVLRRLFGLIGSELQHPLTIDNLSTAWAKIYKSSKFKKIRFVDKSEIYSEDLWFNVNCFERATSAEFLNTIFYIYNKENEASIVHTYHATILKEYSNLYKKMENEIITNKLGPCFNKALNNRIVLNELIMLRNVSKADFSIKKKSEMVKVVLDSPIYRNRFESFNFEALPFAYRLFYKSCKNKNVVIIMLFLLIGESLKKKIKQ